MSATSRLEWYTPYEVMKSGLTFLISSELGR